MVGPSGQRPEVGATAGMRKLRGGFEDEECCSLALSLGTSTSRESKEDESKTKSWRPVCHVLCHTHTGSSWAHGTFRLVLSMAINMPSFT
jgi:hypothetical protein